MFSKSKKFQKSECRDIEVNGPHKEDEEEVWKTEITFPWNCSPKGDKERKESQTTCLKNMLDSFKARVAHIKYDLVLSLTCPKCGARVVLDEKMLEEGLAICPDCGERIEFD